jgi:hypothetical protein
VQFASQMIRRTNARPIAKRRSPLTVQTPSGSEVLPDDRCRKQDPEGHYKKLPTVIRSHYERTCRVRLAATILFPSLLETGEKVRFYASFATNHCPPAFSFLVVGRLTDKPEVMHSDEGLPSRRNRATMTSNKVKLPESRLLDYSSKWIIFG